MFLKLVDASTEIKNAKTLAKCLDEVILEVGIENVMYVITNNATAYVSTGRVLEERYPFFY